MGQRAERDKSPIRCFYKSKIRSEWQRLHITLRRFLILQIERTPCRMWYPAVRRQNKLIATDHIIMPGLIVKPSVIACHLKNAGRCIQERCMDLPGID